MLAAASIAALGTSSPASQGSRAAALLGRWEYVAPPPPPAHGAGLLVALEIDSATNTRFFGRVGRWFSGDMGIRPGVFGRVTGRIDGKAVTIAIPFAKPAAQPITLTTRLAARDTLAIVSARRGTEAGPFRAGPGAFLVRTRRGPARATGKP